MPAPTIPNLISDTEQLQTGTGRQSISATPDAFGAQEARATGAVAQGLDAVASLAADKDDEFNEAEAQELDNELSRRLRDRLYGQENGYLSTQRGRAAVDGRVQVEADIESLVEEIAGTARNERAAAMFRSVGGRRAASAYGDVATYAAQQSRIYQNEQSEGRINEAIDNAVAAYEDPAVVQANMDTAVSELERLRQREGWSPEAYQSRVRRLQSDMSTRVIVSLAATNPEAAQEMYERVRPQLGAQEAGELLTTMRAAQREAREQVTGSIWQAYANGQDPRQLEEWQDFTTNPLYGREHEAFNEYRRQRAASAGSNTYTTRLSEAAGDRLEALGAIDPRRFMTVTDFATGRLTVGDRAERVFVGGSTGWRIVQPDMTTAEFQRQTGMTPEQARGFFSQLNDDDLLRVLNRRSGQTDNSAVDRAYEDVLRVARPLALSMGLDVAGQGGSGAEQRGQFEAYIYREAQAYVAANGARPDDEAVEAIVRRALLQAPSRGLGGRGRYAFEGTAYSDIPRAAREAIEADWETQTGRRPSHTQVERRYAEAMQAMGRQ